MAALQSSAALSSYRLLLRTGREIFRDDLRTKVRTPLPHLSGSVACVG